MRRALVLAALAAVATGPAAAEPSAPSGPVAAAPNVVTNATVEGQPPVKSAKDPDPLVCRAETPIGSKLPVKVCIRRSERDRQKRDSQEALQLIQRRSDGPVKIDTP